MFERMAVLGTGAIGSIIGGYLSRAGRDITLIDTWPGHVETMKEKGLRITAQNDEFTVPVKAIHLGEVANLSEQFDAVFLAVKSYDTVWATHFILPYLKPNGVIVSAQNSINDEWIAPIVGYTRDIACIITLGAGLYEQGHVIQTSSPTRPAFKLGELNCMPSQRAQNLADILSAVGPSKVTTNTWGERWAKLATNCMANPVAALTGLGSAAIRTEPDVMEIPIKLGAEVVKVGKALGIDVEPINGIPAQSYVQTDDPQVMEDMKTQLAESAGQHGEGRPSMLQDVMKGRRTEIEFLDGYVARRGNELGIPTPMCEAITRLIQQVERSELQPDVSNARHLHSYL